MAFILGGGYFQTLSNLAFIKFFNDLISTKFIVMEVNNFKNLFDDDNDAFDFEPHIKHVERNLSRNRQSVSFLTSVVDLFLPNIFRTVVTMIGGEEDEAKKPSASDGSHTHRSDDRNAPTGDNKRSWKN
jgi:hypothetical protein